MNAVITLSGISAEVVIRMPDGTPERLISIHNGTFTVTFEKPRRVCSDVGEK